MIVVEPGEISSPILEFISLKDPHMNFGFANRIRYNHQSDLLSKLDFVRNWCIGRKISHILMTGDVTDTNEEKKWSFNQYVANKNELLKFKEAGITLWSPAGNHDMFNGMAQTTNTVFGEFVREDVLKYLTNTPLYKAFNALENNLNVTKNIAVFGIDYNKHKEVVEANLKVINDFNVPGGCLKIVVFHSHVTPGEIAITEFTNKNLIENFQDIDVFICGHYHGGFPTMVDFKDNGPKKKYSMVINNWSFQRVVRDYYNEMDIHVPEFEYVKIGWSVVSEDFLIARETIKIPCKSYAETFKPKAVELLKLTKKEQFEFFEKINFDDIPVGEDDIETLKNISVKQNFDPAIVTKAIEYLNDVQIDDIQDINN